VTDTTDDLAVQSWLEPHSEAELGWLSFKSKGGGMTEQYPFECVYYVVQGDEGVAYDSRQIFAVDAQTAADGWAEELMRAGHGGGYVVARVGEDEAFADVLNGAERKAELLRRAVGAGVRQRLGDDELLAIATGSSSPLLRSDAVAILKRRSSERPLLRDVLEALNLATFEEGR